jgi:hypothetical protein
MTSTTRSPVLNIEQLNNYIPINTLYHHESWKVLLNEEKELIIKKWRQLLSEVKNINSLSSPEEILNFLMIKNIIIHFDKYYGFNSTSIFGKLIKDPNVLNKLLKKLEDDNDDNKAIKYSKDSNYSINILNTQINVKEFIEKVEELEIENIYNFLSISIRDFSKTWYGKRIINFDNETIISFNSSLDTFDINNNKYYLTYKNIYNYAKSLCFNFKEINTEARCIKKTDWDHFLSLLNNNNSDETFFNIPNNLLRTYDLIYNDSPKVDSNTISKKIDLLIRERLIEIIFETYIYNGVFV